MRRACDGGATESGGGVGEARGREPEIGAKLAAAREDDETQEIDGPSALSHQTRAEDAAAAGTVRCEPGANLFRLEISPSSEFRTISRVL